jgi:hypothetical protein
MSAGTILAMSGDAILMDYYSVLGPIDPQVPSQDGRYVPALGYLIRYQELLDKANGVGGQQITPAEMAILLNYDQGNLYAYQQARDLSIALLKEWLAKYKFKDWRQTATRQLQVTRAMKRERAEEIANALNNVRRWNSHGIGINMDLLRKELKLKIDDFSKQSELNLAVRRYHGLLSDYMGKMDHSTLVHTRISYEPFRG